MGTLGVLELAHTLGATVELVESAASPVTTLGDVCFCLPRSLCHSSRMPPPQPTISAPESRGLDRSGLATLRAYVRTPGGTAEITAPVGERKVIFPDAHHSAA